MRTDDAKRLPLDLVLSQLGFLPVRQAKNGQELWYASPFRQEGEASFHISRVMHPRLGEIWVWKDFGDMGGNVIKFAQRYRGLPTNDVSGALAWLDGLGISTARRDTPSPTLPLPGAQTRPEAPAHPFTDVEIAPLTSRRLLSYLAGRGIDGTLARQYVQQVRYGFDGRTYLALAFANVSGGYEMRSTGRFKGTLPPKVSLLHREKIATGKAVTLFEGFLDYLSALTWYGRLEASTPVIVLNSATMQEPAIVAIKELGAEKVYLYLDRDTTGKKLVQHFTETLANTQVIDHSHIYADHKDFNAFLMAQNQQKSR